MSLSSKIFNQNILSFKNSTNDKKKKKTSMLTNQLYIHARSQTLIFTKIRPNQSHSFIQKILLLTCQPNLITQNLVEKYSCSHSSETSANNSHFAQPTKSHLVLLKIRPNNLQNKAHTYVLLSGQKP